MSKLNIFIISFFVLHVFSMSAQVKTLSMKESEDSLKSVFSRLLLSKTDSERIEQNATIDKLFGDFLKNKESFNYPFDSLKNISKLKSDDGFVRIINWNIQLENGNFLYYAYIQHLDKKKSLELFRLVDKSDEISKPETKELSDKKWYGALYYKILTNRSGKSTYYTLLGWDGGDIFTNKKMIETFIFSGSKIVFGPPIFKMEKSTQNRIIFEFAEQAKMMLRYDEKLKIIVFDHLAPSQNKFEGQFMYYGPDMSQDGLKFENGFWVLKPNLDLRNLQEKKEKPIIKSDIIVPKDN
jgi:hypothetical protein